MDRDLDWCDLNASYGMIEGDGFHIMDKKIEKQERWKQMLSSSPACLVTCDDFSFSNKNTKNNLPFYPIITH
jgi:hypothetical protein